MRILLTFFFLLFSIPLYAHGNNGGCSNECDKIYCPDNEIDINKKKSSKNKLFNLKN